MEIAKAGAESVEIEHQAIPDFRIWVGTPIFSDRAAHLGIELGCDSRDYWPCRFKTNPDEQYFFYLPVVSFDIVDYANSAFLHILPGSPPIPLFVKVLRTKEIPEKIAPCFRATIPGTDIVLSEVLVRDDFKRAWEERDFGGAMFRQMTD